MNSHNAMDPDSLPGSVGWACDERTASHSAHMAPFPLGDVSYEPVEIEVPAYVEPKRGHDAQQVDVQVSDADSVAEIEAGASVGSSIGVSYTDDEMRALLPLPQHDDNKYSRGVLTIVAGSEQYPGAAVLAARAGQRMGAGYTEVITGKTARKLILQACPSVVVGDIEAKGVLEDRVSRQRSKRAVCVGPGYVPDDPHAGCAVAAVLKAAACPVLVDGGGLSALGSKKARKALAKRRKQGFATVITPHVGEAKRLARLFLQCDSADASALSQTGEGQGTSAEALACELAKALGVIAVVKGPDTFISDGMRVYPMREGTPALAKAGTGDVLAGMIASLLAQGLAPFDAAVLGATLHARAGKAAAETYTEIAATPEDVIEAIPAAIRTV